MGTMDYDQRAFENDDAPPLPDDDYEDAPPLPDVSPNSTSDSSILKS